MKYRAVTEEQQRNALIYRATALHGITDDELMSAYRTLHEHGVRGFLKYPAMLWLGWLFGVVLQTDRKGPEA